MAIKTKASLKSFFERGDQPTSAEFSNLMDSLIAIPTSGDTQKNGFLEVISSTEATAHVPSDFSRGLFLNITTTAGARDYLAVTSASSQGGGAAGQALLNANVTASVISLLGTIPGASLASATDSAIGAIEIATTAEVSAAEAVDRAVTPAGMKGHPGVANAWVSYKGSAGVAGSVMSSFNISTVTRDAAGSFTIEFDESPGNIRYGYMAMCEQAGSVLFAQASVGGVEVSSFSLSTINNAFTPSDPTSFTCMFYFTD